ncbi:MAG: hypothetical protein OXH19_07665 [Chloroflexi bacterium]|nr:hypothetical protein [Chloroflexota bacterium]MCY3589394.1 hypothetical protein [Chloroflexota bacterium]MCY3686067.1 hypothetical protein [Chloroflexota bacterium]MDE2709257.1 hypothetical protein [Chloroflexota bacterium]
MAASEPRPYEDIVAQLEDPERWKETGYDEVVRVAENLIINELRLQMHMALSMDAGYSPQIAAGCLTAVHLMDLAHRDRVRYRAGR